MINQAKKYFAFIESNTTGTGRIFVEKALEKGFEILFLTYDPTRYSYLSELLLSPISIDTSNKQKVLNYLSSIKNLQGVFSSSEYYIETAAFVASHLNLPCNTPMAISNCRNKAILCEKLTAAQIPTAQSQLISSLSQAELLLKNLTLPVVVKPVAGSGSVGVKLCRDANSYITHINQLLAETTNERGNKQEAKILIQEYITGDEYSVEVIGTGTEYHIIGITQKYLGAEPYFLEIGHDFPAVLDDASTQLIHSTILAALKTMDLKFGAAHIECRIYNQKVYIIEINPRLAGGMIPALIQQSLGIDILDLVLDLHSGIRITPQRKDQLFSSIRFIIPQKAGTIKAIHQNLPIQSLPGIHLLSFIKQPGDKSTLYGDYRDRIGFIIATGQNIQESRLRASHALNQIQLDIDSTQPAQRIGRLTASLHKEAYAVIKNSFDENKFIQELIDLTAIDEAHLLMLYTQKLISVDIIRKILAQIQHLKQTNFTALLNREASRGTYFLYESELIDQLGMEIGGVIHTGRSRNDINATLFKLSARKLFQSIYEAIWRLRQTILLQANKYKSVLMPIYSQFQPAMPGTYSYYLLSIEEALSRDQTSIKNNYELLSESPLGAGAGCGTSVSINPAITAAYLGFSKSCNLALDAIASRDGALRLLSSISILGTTLSRIAQDYQLWTTQEFAFFHLPDELAGGSSMMPQKKNPYLLEKIKGKSIQPTAQLMMSLSTMQKTPFSNSVEVGTEALVDFEKTIKTIIDATTLLKLIISHAQPLEKNMQNSCEKGITMAVCVTEKLVNSGMPFREAHHTVGETIRTALEQNTDPVRAIHALLPAIDSDINQWPETFKYGGGCSSDLLEQHLNIAQQRLQDDGRWMYEVKNIWNKAEVDRNKAIAELIKTPPPLEKGD